MAVQVMNVALDRIFGRVENGEFMALLSIAPVRNHAAALLEAPLPKIVVALAREARDAPGTFFGGLSQGERWRYGVDPSQEGIPVSVASSVEGFDPVCFGDSPDPPCIPPAYAVFVPLPFPDLPPGFADRLIALLYDRQEVAVKRLFSIGARFESFEVGGVRSNEPNDYRDAEDAKAREQCFAAGCLERCHYCSEHGRAQAPLATRLTTRQDCDYLYLFPDWLP